MTGEKAHEGVTYDLEVDTTSTESLEIARIIAGRVSWGCAATRASDRRLDAPPRTFHKYGRLGGRRGDTPQLPGGDHEHRSACALPPISPVAVWTVRCTR